MDRPENEINLEDNNDVYKHKTHWSRIDNGYITLEWGDWGYGVYERRLCDDDLYHEKSITHKFPSFHAARQLFPPCHGCSRGGIYTPKPDKELTYKGWRKQR